MQDNKQQLEPDMEQQTCSKLGKEYIKAVYYHPGYLTSMQSSVQFSRSVVSNSFQAHEGMPGLPVHHQLPEFTQTHVHWVSDAIQPSHPLSSPSLPAFYLSQHQGLFKWLSSCACFGSTYTKIGTIQRLAWPLRKDDTQIHEAFHIKKQKQKQKKTQFFASGSQSIGVSASASVLPMNIQDWFPLGLTDLISLQSKGPSRVFSSTTIWKY